MLGVAALERKSILEMQVRAIIEYRVRESRLIAISKGERYSTTRGFQSNRDETKRSALNRMRERFDVFQSDPNLMICILRRCFFPMCVSKSV